jgi:protein O-GlcNAc transferase
LACPLFNCFRLWFGGLEGLHRKKKVDPEQLAESLAKKFGSKQAQFYEEQLQIKDDQIKALSESLTALSKAPLAAKTINHAFQALEQGNPNEAKSIFAEIAENKSAEGRKANKEAAAAFRHMGALAFLTDTQEALEAYRKAVDKDPDNADGWNQLGHLLTRIGKLNESEQAYQRVFSIGTSRKEDMISAAALGNLGLVYSDLGEVPKAIEHLQKALVIFEEIKSPTAERVHQWLEELASTKTR